MTEINLHNIIDIAMKLKMQPRVIYETCRKHQIANVIIGNNRFLTQESLDKLIKACETVPSNKLTDEYHDKNCVYAVLTS